MGKDAEQEIETLNLELQNKQTENMIKAKSEQTGAEIDTGKLELEAMKIK